MRKITDLYHSKLEVKLICSLLQVLLKGSKYAKKQTQQKFNFQDGAFSESLYYAAATIKFENLTEEEIARAIKKYKQNLNKHITGKACNYWVPFPSEVITVLRYLPPLASAMIMLFLDYLNVEGFLKNGMIRLSYKDIGNAIGRSQGNKTMSDTTVNQMIEQLIAVGLLKVWRGGIRNGKKHMSTYALTWLPTCDEKAPTKDYLKSGAYIGLKPQDYSGDRDIFKNVQKDHQTDLHTNLKLHTIAKADMQTRLREPLSTRGKNKKANIDKVVEDITKMRPTN